MPSMIPRRFEDQWDYKQYLKWLEKDLRKFATRGRMHQFFLAKGVRHGGSKRTVLLIANDEDDEWKPVLDEIANEASKFATGLCRIAEQRNTVIIAIKMMFGDLRRDKAIQLLNEKLLDKFQEIRAIDHREFMKEENRG